jgi:hypothetical protein
VQVQVQQQQQLGWEASETIGHSAGLRASLVLVWSSFAGCPSLQVRQRSRGVWFDSSASLEPLERQSLASGRAWQQVVLVLGFRVMLTTSFHQRLHFPAQPPCLVLTLRKVLAVAGAVLQARMVLHSTCVVCVWMMRDVNGMDNRKRVDTREVDATIIRSLPVTIRLAFLQQQMQTSINRQGDCT